MTRKFRVVPLLVAAVLALSACGGGDEATDAAPAQTPAAPAPATTQTPEDTTAVEKVSANDASEDELKAALESGGVPNPGRWADEIVEYRPYPENDTDFAKLRTKLAKYNPGDEVLAKIIAVLKA